MNSSFFSNTFMCNIIALLFAIFIFVIILSIKNTVFYQNHILLKKWLWPLIDIFLGTVLSTIFFLTFFLSSINANNTINAVTIILIILPGVFYTSPYFGIGGIIPMMIGSFLLFSLNHISIIYVVTSYLIYLMGILLIFYFLPKIPKIFQTIASHIFCSIGQIILILTMSYGLNLIDAQLQKELWIVSSILQLFIFLSWYIMVYVNRIYQKTQLMNKQAAYDYKYFVVSNYAQYAINDFIKKHNIQYAYVIGFSIRNIKKTNFTVSKRMINEIQQHVANQIKVFFDSYPAKLLFMSENDFFFTIIKADVSIVKSLKLMNENNYLKKRKKNDPLIQFESFHLRPYEFQGVKFVPQTSLLVGLYGVHDNDIFNLIYDVQTMIEWFEFKNEYSKVQLFNAQIESNIRYDMEQFQRLKQLFDIHQINQKSRIIYYQNQKIIFPIFSLFKLAAFNTDNIIKMTPEHFQVIMIKYLAAKALQQFSIMNNKHELLMIRYPIQSLMDQNFSAQIFNNKILYFDLSPNQIILLLDLRLLGNKSDQQNIIANINSLKKIGIKFVYKNVNVHNIDFVIQTKPYFVFYHHFTAKNYQEQEYMKLMKKMFTKAKVNYYVI
ncbi:MAG: hypothetical protein LBF36_02400 [Mycoplasmataceae bacterium]|nr:hypothetical protein [Mycoplasmataceae bacterium]